MLGSRHYILLEVNEMVWEEGCIYNALHKVGDDPLKGMIEDEFEKEFKKEPKILDRIADVFARCLKDYGDD